jgi:hypothetical protein
VGCNASNEAQQLPVVQEKNVKKSKDKNHKLLTATEGELDGIDLQSPSLW